MRKAVCQRGRRQGTREGLKRVEEHSARETRIVCDDGIGIGFGGVSSGKCLGTMRKRAASIGARLSVVRGENKGTVVTCILDRNPHKIMQAR
jgi:nitrate/nitrite-specific signal transduction histidine kinase